MRKVTRLFIWCWVLLFLSGPTFAKTVMRSSTDGVIALDLKTGRELWRFFPKEKGQITILDAGKTVYIIQHESTRLYRLDAATGKVLMQKSIALPKGQGLRLLRCELAGEGESQRLLLHCYAPGGRGPRGSRPLVIVNPQSAGVLSIVPNSRGARTRTHLLQSVYDHNTRQVAVQGISLKTGKQEWEANFPGWKFVSVPDRDPLLVGNDAITCISPQDGREKWRCVLMKTKAGEGFSNFSLLKSNGSIAVFECRHKQEEYRVGIDIQTGKLLWQHPVLYAQYRGMGSYLALQSGSYRARGRSPGHPVVFADESAYFCDGWKLMRFPLHQGKGTSVWPSQEQEKNYEIYAYIIDEKGVAYVSAADLKADSLVFVQIDEGKERFLYRSEQRTLIYPVHLDRGVLFADFAEIGETRSRDSVSKAGILAFEITAGRVLWKKPWTRIAVSQGWDRLLEKGLIPTGGSSKYITSSHFRRGIFPPKGFSALQSKDGAVRWRADTKMYESRLYEHKECYYTWASDYGGGAMVQRLDPVTGDVSWSRKLERQHQPAAAGNNQVPLNTRRRGGVIYRLSGSPIFTETSVILPSPRSARPEVVSEAEADLF